MKNLKIGQVAGLLGIQAHTLRTWEKRYCIRTPARSLTNIRLYDTVTLRELFDISLLNQLHYKISFVSRLSPLQRKKKINESDNPGILAQKTVNELLTLALECKIEDFEMLLDGYLSSAGINTGIEKVLLPLQEKTKLLKQQDGSMPVGLRLAYHLIRQKILVQLEHLPSQGKGSCEAVLLVSPGCQNELCPLFLYYTLRRKGIKVFYLGRVSMSAGLKDLLVILRPGFLLVYTEQALLRESRDLTNLIAGLPFHPVLMSMDEKACDPGWAQAFFDRSIEEAVHLTGA
ncbi:MAG TPA: MerR family DNA-binding transcriptional regulator [Flavisolibacter sp.]|nr:MerR family DNA-binding transcriptional regulator [Flavisolibacter sp.]